MTSTTSVKGGIGQQNGSGSSSGGVGTGAGTGTGTGTGTGGRITGFSRLINEKTMIKQKSEIDQVLDEFCDPSSDLSSNEEMISKFEEKKLYAIKFLREAFSRLKHNQFHIIVEEPYIATHANDLIFTTNNNDILLDVYLSLRRPASLKVLGQSMGQCQLQIPSPPKPDEEKLDVMECLRCSKIRQRRLLSSTATVQCIYQLLLSSRQDLLKTFRPTMLQIDSPMLLTQENGIYCVIRCHSSYLTYSLAAPPQQQKSDLEKESSDSSDDGDDGDGNGKDKDNDNNNDDDDDDDNGRGGEEENDNETLLTSARGTKLFTNSSKRNVEKETMCEIRLKIFPGYCLNVKEKIFLLGRPYPWWLSLEEQQIIDESLWHTYATHRESIILDYAFKADKSIRHRAWKIITDLCSREIELKIIQREHVKQALLQNLEYQVDHHQSQWQRESLSIVIQEIFYHLRDSLQKKQLEHYFVDGLNMLHGLTTDEMSRAMVRCSVLAKSVNVLCNTLKRALKDKKNISKVSLIA